MQPAGNEEHGAVAEVGTDLSDLGAFAALTVSPPRGGAGPRRLTSTGNVAPPGGSPPL